MRGTSLCLSMIVGVAGAWAAAAATAPPAHADPTCHFEPHPAAEYGMPEALVGPTVSLRRCVDGAAVTETLHASVRLGPLARIGVWGPHVATAGCLAADRAVEVWPGLSPALAVSLCRGADGGWTPRVTGALSIGVTRLPVVDAVVEHVTDHLGPVRLRLPALALGPFTLSDAVIATAISRGELRPSGITGTLRWNNAPGGALMTVAGTFDADGLDELELGVTIAEPPPGFPFPGIQLPPLDARFALGGRSWRLFVAAA